MDLLQGFEKFQDSCVFTIIIVVQLWEAQGIMQISNTFNHFWNGNCKGLSEIQT